MAFCSFSKDCDGNSYVTVENKFITKYLPEADGFAVKVYLYGLYLCKNADSDFGLKAMAEVLKTTETKIAEAFEFWEDYDLVQVISKSPFAVQYLPVKSAVGKPKKVRYEQYADFNKELQRKMQKVGKFVSAGDYLKYMRFMEENAIQPQALLLITEYCINKRGDAVSPSHIFNKAKKLLASGASTYEQVERELSNYNVHEKDLLAIFTALGGYQRTPDENDYSYYRKWTETLGFTKDAIITAAKKTGKRGSMTALEIILEDLYDKGKTDAGEIEGYLTERETLTSLTFRIARKLGVKVSNPAAYVDEYVEKWFTYGFEDSSLLDIALFCLKTERGSFDSMNTIVERLFENGVVSKESVKAFLKQKNDELKLFDKIREFCGTIRKSATNVSLIRTWRDWKFSDEMILEAAKRSATSANPVPYMNKILSDWKQAEIFEIKNIPDSAPSSATSSRSYTNPSIDAANAKADRERYYALLREKAQSRADKFVRKANGNARFKALTAELSTMEISLAKAEVFEPKNLPALQEKKALLLSERKGLLMQMGISEDDLLPKFVCPKCSDTGFLKNGAACDCYKP